LTAENAKKNAEIAEREALKIFSASFAALLSDLSG